MRDIEWVEIKTELMSANIWRQWSTIEIAVHLNNDPEPWMMLEWSQVPRAGDLIDIGELYRDGKPNLAVVERVWWRKAPNGNAEVTLFCRWRDDAD